jgi:hypothetical protein
MVIGCIWICIGSGRIYGWLVEELDLSLDLSLSVIKRGIID